MALGEIAGRDDAIAGAVIAAGCLPLLVALMAHVNDSVAKAAAQTFVSVLGDGVGIGRAHYKRRWQQAMVAGAPAALRSLLQRTSEELRNVAEAAIDMLGRQDE